MKLKFFITLFLMIVFSLNVKKEVFKAVTMQAINTENPPSTVELEAISNMDLGDIQIEKGYVLYGDFIDLIPPRAWGKNATFSVKLTKYKDLRGDEHAIQGEHVIKYRQALRPQYDRAEFSLMGSSDGGRTESGVCFSPYDIKLMKESKNVGEFLWKDMNKDSAWNPGFELKYKPKETIYFNY